MAVEPDWEARYRRMASSFASARRALRVLRYYSYLLPRHGLALDLACGLGANARLLASRGLEVYAWDSAAAAIDRLQALAAAEAVHVHAAVRDVVLQPPEPEQFDIIVVGYFLERSLVPAIIAGLRPGGLLYYQSWTVEATDSEYGPRQRQWCLEPGELLGLYARLTPLIYREEGGTGDCSRGLRGQAYLVARKPRVPGDMIGRAGHADPAQ